LALVTEHDIKPEQIEEVVVGVDAGALHYCEPVSVRHFPRNHIDLQFSIPYNVVNVIFNRKVKFEHFSEKALERKDIMDFLASRVRSWVDPEVSFDDVNKACTAARIQMKLKDGRTYAKQVNYPKGNPDKPMTKDELIEKFFDCAELLARPIDKGELEQVVDHVLNLEKLKDVTRIVNLLVPVAPNQ